jgi:hypothetical protein
MGKSPGDHCEGSSPCELVIVVSAGLEKYHSPLICTLVAVGSK